MVIILICGVIALVLVSPWIVLLLVILRAIL